MKFDFSKSIRAFIFKIKNTIFIFILWLWLESVILSLNEGENPTTFYAGINDLITFPIALNNLTYQLNVTSYTSGCPPYTETYNIIYNQSAGGGNLAFCNSDQVLSLIHI